MFLMKLVVLAAVIFVAFFTPQVLFYVQDRILYGDTQLSTRESVDTEALGGTYEKSLYQRMLRFAEGLSAGRRFYVTSKNLTPDEELEEYLNSGSLYQGLVNYLLGMDLIPLVLWDKGYTVSEWKQYVVYSEDYSAGVNFLLWYIELEFMEGVKLKLLTDAETETLYALKSENCQWKDSNSYFSDRLQALEDQSTLTELWCFSSIYFEIFSSPDVLPAGERIETDRETGKETIIYSQGNKEIDDSSVNFGEEKVQIWLKELLQMADAWAGETDITDSAVYGEYIDQESVRKYIWDKIESSGENGDICYHFHMPYGESVLDMTVNIKSWQTEDSGIVYMYPDLTIGIQQIYERIPEFSDKQ